MELKKRILIMDNDERQIDRIEKQLAGNAVLFNRKIQVYKVDTVSAADEIIRDVDIDILILNGICQGMPLEDNPGICFVKKLRTWVKYKTLPVIFISSVDKPMEYAYKDLNCLAYLAKEFDADIFKRVIEKAFQYTTSRDEEPIIWFNKHTVSYLIKIEDIIYVQSEKRRLHIYLSEKRILEITNKTMAELCKETANRVFVVCNKGTMVNRAYIKTIKLEGESPYLTMTDNNIRIPISRRYTARIKEEMKTD